MFPGLEMFWSNGSPSRFWVCLRVDLFMSNVDVLVQFKKNTFEKVSRFTPANMGWSLLDRDGYRPILGKEFASEQLAHNFIQQHASRFQVVALQHFVDLDGAKEAVIQIVSAVDIDAAKKFAVWFGYLIENDFEPRPALIVPDEDGGWRVVDGDEAREILKTKSPVDTQTGAQVAKAFGLVN